jgi:hypothetical protein
VSLSTKLGGQTLYRVEVTRTFVGYVIADGEVEAASFVGIVSDEYEGAEAVGEDWRITPCDDPPAEDRDKHTFNNFDAITVAEYLAAKGGER